MKTMLAISFLFAAPLAGAQDGPKEDLGPAGEYRILYAGAPGGEREQAFLELLRPWFARVDAIDLAELNATSAAPYDVVIADWSRRYSPEGGFASASGSDFPSSRGRIGDDFTKPIVMVGAVAGEVQRRSKIDWL